MDPSQLAQVEAVCNELYRGSSEAQQQLLVLQTSVDYIPQCQYILDNSTQVYAQVVAATSLEILITQFWTNFTVEQKIDVRNYVLNLLASKAHSLNDLCVGGVAKLLCKITKLGWFDSPEHREIVTEVTKFLEATVAHNIVGLKILNSLVEEMNSPIAGRTLTIHRKTAVSFRDHALCPVFQLSVTILRQVHSGAMDSTVTLPEKKRIEALALQLVNACLSFDFIGTNPEDSAEDIGVVQVPSSWAPIAQGADIVQLCFAAYGSNAPPSSRLALQCLVQLSSIRRSWFAGDKERFEFLQALMTGIRSILQSRQGLDQEENFHEFCRLLGRLKASYQLSEIVRVTHFSEWLELSCQFTIESLASWQTSSNSIHYLLALWGRMVAALGYLRSDTVDAQRQVAQLRQCVLQVTEAYIKTMLGSVEIVVREDAEDPLADEGSLREQMERLPVLARIHYETVAGFMVSTFEGLLQLYQSMGLASASSRKRILEGQCAWMIQMIAAVIGSPSAQTTDAYRSNQVELVCDGKLCRCVFQLLQMTEMRLSSTNGTEQSFELLDMAFLQFFRSFKKAYLADTRSGVNTGMSFVSSSTPVHPLLSLALSSPDASGDVAVASSEVNSVYEAMNIGDVPFVMNIIVTKMCNNIKYLHASEEILAETLDIFGDMVSTYASSRTLLDLEAVTFLVNHHDGSHFPFLGYSNLNKDRIQFYSTLSRLVFTSAEDQFNSFDAFIAPNIDILHQLAAMSDFRTSPPGVRLAVIGAFRDLRGIAVSTFNKRTYNLLFDALYPDGFALLARVVDVWFDDPIVMTAALKFLNEITQNKLQRIVFDQCSANGILLFRETSTILCSYGSRILAVPVIENIYVEKYKGIRIMLNTLVGALSGDYVNFGVFALYNDQALQNVLDVSLQLCLQIPLTDVIAFVKLSKAYFSFFEVLFRSHLDVLCGLDSSVFLQLIRNVQEGLQSGDAVVSSYCSNAIDHLATYLFLNMTKEKPAIQMIRAHVASEPGILTELITTLFNSLLFSPSANHWALTRPVLPLLLAAESAFLEYQAQLMSTQASPENRDKLNEEFGKLIAEVARSVDTSNRDKFTQRLTMFRLNVRQFLTL